MYGGGAPIAGRTAHLESSIPLILIIILAIFVAGQFGLVNFSDIPLLKDIFPNKQIKVAVVGTPSAGLKEMMYTQDARYAQIYYAGNLRVESLYSKDALRNFDIVILMGQPVCDRTQRAALTNWAKGGGRLIVVGDACTRVTDDPAVCGWEVGLGLLGDVVPAKICGLTHQPEPIRRGCSSGRFVFANYNHPIGSGIDEFQFIGNTIETVPNANADIVAYIECSDSGRGNVGTTPAIIESTGMLSGKTIYLAYDPAAAKSRNMFINMLKYMKGQKG